jgi:hypothetical protein
MGGETMNARFVIQMSDGTYFMQSKPTNTIFTTSKLSEAAIFQSRFEALITAGQGIQFANAKIVQFNFPEAQPDGFGTDVV